MKIIVSVLSVLFLVVGWSLSKPFKIANANYINDLSKYAMEVDTVESGFKPLFNGKNFDDWELLLRDGTPEEAKKVYTIIEDGVLHFFRDLPAGSGNGPERRNAFHGVMATKKSYSKYHLKFEYKWGEKLVNNYDQYQYDAGVFYHIMKLEVFPKGLQYQVRFNHLENKNHSGDFIASRVKMQWYSKDGKTFELRSKGGKPQPSKTGQHYGVKDASFNGLNDQWNVCEIIVMDNEYAIHKLNGKLVNMATNLEPSEGPIALEAETGEIFWRNIQIKEFEKVIPADVFLE